LAKDINAMQNLPALVVSKLRMHLCWVGDAFIVRPLFLSVGYFGAVLPAQSHAESAIAGQKTKILTPKSEMNIIQPTLTDSGDSKIV
jgi:hypothetical protein